MEEKENVIEWITGDDTIGVTVTQKKFINKILKLREKHPDLIEIVGDNVEIDGSLYARLPLRALHLSIINGKPNPNFGRKENNVGG